MQKPKKIVIIAGEESGDIHAANFVEELKSRNKNLSISGIGGQHMQKAGVTLISDLARYGVTGITEVIQHIFVIRKAYKAIKKHLIQEKPDLLILVDYPGFNLRLAKFAKQTLGLKIIYYISPQIWAWKANRIHTIQKNVDKMAVILPFEKKIYKKSGVPVEFVGHPLANKPTITKTVAEIKTILGLAKDQQVCAMLPGSRKNEILRLMPVIRDTAKKLLQQHPNLHFVIPIAQTIDKNLVSSYLADLKNNFTIVSEQAIEVLYCCDVAVVSSGTASLECALLTKPMCIIYKSSWITYLAASKLILVKFLGLCNLLQNKMIVPELLQYDCNEVELAKTVSGLISNKNIKNRMINELTIMKESLSSQQADISISGLIEQELA
ncbi:MAG: lipid-A-disaccharide synthase [Legionellaceae bacterium]|nr:lipid-A-disaccharide synthase [Legionellaceae bacterium]